MSDNQMRYCTKCNKRTLHVGPSTTHVLHFLLSLFTLGAWLFVWFFISIRNEFSYECTSCDDTKLNHNIGKEWGKPGYNLGIRVRSALNQLKKFINK